MTETEALHHFKHIISIPCPECKARAGELCRSNGVWVHLIRFSQQSKK